jgi:ABC-type Mn2+/Zn2+ transport system permease subunit
VSLTFKPESQPRKRGVVDAVLVILGAAMVMLPSYVAYELMNRLKVAVSTAALLALAIFLVGAFVLIRVLRE